MQTAGSSEQTSMEILNDFNLNGALESEDVLVFDVNEEGFLSKVFPVQGT